MAKLTISRTNQWTNRFRKIHIYMDNKLFCKISNGETQTIDVPVGSHTLFAQSDWLASEPIDLNFETDTEIKLEVGSPLKQPFYIAVIYFVLLFGGLYLQKHYHDDRFLFITSGLILTLAVGQTVFTQYKSPLYYLTWGRKKYVYLKEI